MPIFNLVNVRRKSYLLLSIGPNATVNCDRIRNKYFFSFHFLMNVCRRGKLAKYLEIIMDRQVSVMNVSHLSQCNLIACERVDIYPG